MMVLALEREIEGVPAESFEPHLRDEALRVWELQQAGFVRQAYFRADESSAVLLLEATSLLAAEETLATLPLVACGLIRFDLIPLRAYPGYARLFAEPG